MKDEDLRPGSAQFGAWPLEMTLGACLAGGAYQVFHPVPECWHGPLKANGKHPALNWLYISLNLDHSADRLEITVQTPTASQLGK
jgi:hypothetical protein